MIVRETHTFNSRLKQDSKLEEQPINLNEVAVIILKVLFKTLISECANDQNNLKMFEYGQN